MEGERGREGRGGRVSNIYGGFFSSFLSSFFGLVFRFWLFGFLASWLLGFSASWLLGFLAFRLFGFLASWLFGFSASWLFGFLLVYAAFVGFLALAVCILCIPSSSSAVGVLAFAAFRWFMRLLAALAFRILCFPSSSSGILALAPFQWFFGFGFPHHQHHPFSPLLFESSLLRTSGGGLPPTHLLRFLDCLQSDCTPISINTSSNIMVGAAASPPPTPPLLFRFLAEI